MRPALIVCCLFALAGCATLQDKLDAVHTDLQALKGPDLDAALASASRPNAHGEPIDPDGVTCFTTLKAMNAEAAATLPEIKGILSTIEAVRVTRLEIEDGANGKIARINSACAAWYMSVKKRVVETAIDVMKMLK